jgi:hypothetical protein
MIIFKCAKAHGLDEMAEESMKKADEIYAKEENESHRKSRINISIFSIF